MNQLAEATRLPGSGSGSSRMISTLTDVSVNDLDRVEVSAYQAETTDGRL